VCGAFVKEGKFVTLSFTISAG